MTRQAPALEEIVERFYPERLSPTPADRFATHAVLQSAPGGEPSVLLAAYTDRTGGVARVLARTGAGAWDAVAETPDFLLLPGGRCAIRLEDLDSDGRPEPLIFFQAPRGTTTWVFRWDGTRLLNVTPTQPARNGEASVLLSTFLYDLDHTGPLRVVAERTIERPAPGQRPRNPAYVYRLGADRLEVEKTVVAVMAFRADVDPRANLRPFRLIQDSQPPYTLRVINGERGGRNRVSGATIFINNRSVADQREINDRAEFSVTTLQGLITENHLTATLTGSPDARIIAMIEDGTNRNA